MCNLKWIRSSFQIMPLTFDGLIQACSFCTESVLYFLRISAILGSACKHTDRLKVTFQSIFNDPEQLKRQADDYEIRSTETYICYTSLTQNQTEEVWSLEALLTCLIYIFQKQFDHELFLFNPNGNPGGFMYLYPYLLD